MVRQKCSGIRRSYLELRTYYTIGPKPILFIDLFYTFATLIKSTTAASLKSGESGQYLLHYVRQLLYPYGSANR